MGGRNLVLQDLSQTTRAVSQVEGCSPAEAVAVGAELARLHTAYWDHPDLGSAAWLLDRRQGASHSADVQLAAAAAFRDRFEIAWQVAVSMRSTISRGGLSKTS
jgi:predicted 3-demethylubiquinone-9 3-methyltransferase (glyoxalase superfamily)